MCQIRSLTPAVLGVLLSAAPAPVPTQPQPAPNKMAPKDVQALLEKRGPVAVVPGEIIVKHKTVAGRPQGLAPARVNQLKIAAETRTLSGGETIYRLQADGLTGLSAKSMRERTLAAVAAMKTDPAVEYAQPNYILRIQSSAPIDPSFPRQWHYKDNGTGAGQSPGGIGLQSYWDTNKGRRSMVVAVIDTGILPNHEDIAGSPNLIAGYDMITDGATANDGGGRDADPTDTGDGTSRGECGAGSPPEPSSWHGTHVAGTIGVVRTDNSKGVAGVNWEVSVEPVRVLGKCGGSIADINDGIRWAAGLPVPGVPTNANKAKVINLSLGGAVPCAESPSTQAAINDAVAAGVTVVVAAGNSAQDASGFLPAGCDNVITVAASDARGQLVTRYSNFGPTVEIMAPGGDVQRDDDHDGNPDGVYSTVAGGYAYYNGTSMAAPHVAGAAALLLATDSTLTPAQVAQRLKDTALPRTAAQCPKPCGAGLLSLVSMLSLTVSPARLDLSVGASPGALQASVREGGQPKAGQAVRFTSGNAGVATVAPATAVTDANGNASTQVTPVASGETQVETEAGSASQQTPVRVPALSGALAVLLAILLYVAARRSARFRSADRS